MEASEDPGLDQPERLNEGELLLLKMEYEDIYVRCVSAYATLLRLRDGKMPETAGTTEKLLNRQLDAMERYLDTLKQRLNLEGVDNPWE